MESSKIPQRGPIPQGLPSASLKLGADVRRMQRKETLHERVLSGKMNTKQSKKTINFKPGPLAKNYMQKS
jgi:hypothetical protein